MVLRLIENHVEVLEASHDAFEHLVALLADAWAWIERRVEASANFLDAVLELFTLEEGGEDGLVEIVALKIFLKFKLFIQSTAVESF